MMTEDRHNTCIHSTQLSGLATLFGGVYSGTCTGKRGGTDCSGCSLYLGIHTPTQAPKNGLQQEVSMIKNPVIRSFTEEVLKTVPSYFWTAPASSSGKYHPIDSRGVGGLVRHVKKVVFISSTFVRAFGIESLYDLVYSALILHDGKKFGEGDGDLSMFPNHGRLMVDHIHGLIKSRQIQIAPDYRESIRQILRAILSHTGKWHGDQEKVPQTSLEQVVHLSDMMSSNKGVINYWTPDGEIIHVG